MNNKILTVCNISGVIVSSISGLYLGYHAQKDCSSVSCKILSTSFGFIFGAALGYPIGFVGTLTSPITLPIIIYDYYDQNH